MASSSTTHDIIVGGASRIEPEALRAYAGDRLGDQPAGDDLRMPSRVAWPECPEPLWEIEDGRMLRLRCHVGHAFAADAMLAAQTEEIDRLMGTLVRSHQEQAAPAQWMADHERANDRHVLADQLEGLAGDYDDEVRTMGS